MINGFSTGIYSDTANAALRGVVTSMWELQRSKVIHSLDFAGYDLTNSGLREAGPNANRDAFFDYTLRLIRSHQLVTDGYFHRHTHASLVPIPARLPFPAGPDHDGHHHGSACCWDALASHLFQPDPSDAAKRCVLLPYVHAYLDMDLNEIIIPAEYDPNYNIGCDRVQRFEQQFGPAWVYRSIQV